MFKEENLNALVAYPFKELTTINVEYLLGK